MLRIPLPALVRKSIRLFLLVSFFSWLSTTSAVRGKHSSPLLLFPLPCLPRLRLVVLIQFTHSAYSRLEICCLFVAPLLFRAGMSLAVCYSVTLILRCSPSVGFVFHPLRFCLRASPQFIPSFALLRLVILTPVSSSLSLGVTYYCSVRFPSYVLSVGVILHTPVSGVLTLLTLLFAFPTAKVRQAVLLKIPQWDIAIYCTKRSSNLPHFMLKWVFRSFSLKLFAAHFPCYLLDAV